jgi:8-oxo-dGTP pyrophosphatase MutT (NUDIX family)
MDERIERTSLGVSRCNEANQSLDGMRVGFGGERFESERPISVAAAAGLPSPPMRYDPGFSASRPPMSLLPDSVFRSVLDPLEGSWRSRPGLRDAAVLLAVVARTGGDAVLFIRRREDLPSHGGEVAFPGGARDQDEDAIACACREATEETGLRTADIQLFGRLPERISIAGYTVHPFVARISPRAELVADPGEVSALLEIPLRELREPERWEWRDLPSRRTERIRRLPFFLHDGEILWGLTAMFTLDFLGRLPPCGNNSSAC